MNFNIYEENFVFFFISVRSNRFSTENAPRQVASKVKECLQIDQFMALWVWLLMEFGARPRLGLLCVIL
jgi:hypothetical protein